MACCSLVRCSKPRRQTTPPTLPTPLLKQKKNRFAAYNVAGALLWTVLFVGAGFFFGNLPVVQHNFTLVVLGIVAVSVVPVLLEVLAARREAARGGGGENEEGGPKVA